MKVTLEGGPFDGQEVEVSCWGASLVLEGGDVPEGMVARYRPTRIKTPPTYRFREYDRVVARLPEPGAAA